MTVGWLSNELLGNLLYFVSLFLSSFSPPFGSLSLFLSPKHKSSTELSGCQRRQPSHPGCQAFSRWNKNLFITGLWWISSLPVVVLHQQVYGTDGEGFKFFFSSIRWTPQVQISGFPFSLSFFLLALKLLSIAKPKLSPGYKMHIVPPFKISTLAQEPHSTS